MSYDMSIGDEAFNITYNVGGMFYAANPAGGIRAHYGMTGREALPFLLAMREYMEEHKAALEAMSPQNGWGSYETALQFVTDIINASIRNPDAVWIGD